MNDDYIHFLDGKLHMSYTPNRASQSSKINDVAEVGVVLAISYPNNIAEMEYAISFWDNWAEMFFSVNNRRSNETKQLFSIVYLLDYYIYKYQDNYSTEEAFMWNFFVNNLGLKAVTKIHLIQKEGKAILIFTTILVIFSTNDKSCR